MTTRTAKPIKLRGLSATGPGARYLLGLVCAATLCFAPRPASGQEELPLTFAVLPRFSELEVKGQFSALVGELRKATGRRIVFRQAPSFEAHSRMLMSEDVDFSYQNPFIFAHAMDKVDLVASTVIGGVDKHIGIALVRSDSGFKDLSSLKGKSVGILGRTSAGLIGIRIRALDEGFDFMESCKILEIPGNKVDKAILSVVDKTVDAAIMNTKDLSRLPALLPTPDEVRVLVQGTPLPGWAFGARKELDPAIVRAVQDRLLSLPEGSLPLTRINIDRFIKENPDSYTPMRKISPK